jgi:hypothetical protein
VGIISPTIKTSGHEEASGPPGPIGTWEMRKGLTNPGLSLGLIGNASGKNSDNEVELGPRRFR